ncbi:MAG: hypothetical protein H6667_09180 [Ardenticatenaceae bacterium]|nr:hypothetical protein [Ardenticatenaceae bacterium]
MIDDFKTISFSTAAAISNDPIDLLPGFNSGAWLNGLGNEAIDAIVRYGAGIDGPSPLIFAEVRDVGGAIGLVDDGTAVYGNRVVAELLLSLVDIAPTPGVPQPLAGYTGQLKEVLRPYLTGGVYMNFWKELNHSSVFGMDWLLMGMNGWRH